jgi:hypothetical protein
MQQTAHLRTLLDQVVSVTRDGLPRAVRLADGQRGQAVAFDRGMKDRFQIAVIGLQIRMERLAVMIGRKRMHDPRVETAR